MLAMALKSPTWAERGHCREGAAECKGRRLLSESLRNHRPHGMMWYNIACVQGFKPREHEP
jgi:hypothetical protein